MAKFRPVRCAESVINATPIINGYTYFATDTGKIYVDTATERIPMGGAGSAIYYALAETVETLDDDLFALSKDDLENEKDQPKVGDLIINSDGSFYKVLAVLDTSFECTRLAVSGGGGGGGGGSFSDKAKLNKRDPESNYLINGKSASISIYAISGKDPDDGTPLDSKLTVYWTLSEKTSTGILSQYAQGNFPIEASTDADPIWETFEYGTKARHSTTNVLTMYVLGSSSTKSREITYEFYTSTLELLEHPNFSNVNTYSPDGVTIYCTTVGDLEKIIYYYFETNGVETLLNPSGTVVGAGTNEQSFVVPASLATHGSHKVRIELYQYINGKADLTSSATPIEMEIGVVEHGNDKPIIWLGAYQSEYYQYDSIKIPFRVYDPNAVLSTEITLYKDNNKIGTRNITDNTAFSIWEIVDGDLNMMNYYTISCGADELETRRDISFLISEDPARANMKIATAGLRYQFDASGRSNSESATNRAKSVYSDGTTTVAAKFENFN